MFLQIRKYSLVRELFWWGYLKYPGLINSTFWSSWSTSRHTSLFEQQSWKKSKGGSLHNESNSSKKCIFHTFWYSYECNRLKSACGVKKNFRKYDLWDESVYHFQTPWLLVPNCQCTHIISFLAHCAIQPWDWTADPPF